MKAIIVDQAKAMHWQTVDDLEIGNGEIRIKVHATAINRADLLQRLGFYPPPAGASPILGLECAGEVIEIGEGVDQFQIGDHVAALLPGGGYASEVVCVAAHALKIPAGLDLVQAACLMEVYATAWLNLFQLAKLEKGDSALIHAGASGVGIAAIQLCRHHDVACFVTTGSDEKIAFCQSMGAAGGWNRHSAIDLSTRLRQWRSAVDVVLDPVGGSYLDQNIELLAVDGRLVIIGLMGGTEANLNLRVILSKRLSLIGSTLRNRNNEAKASIVNELKQFVWPLIESGKIQIQPFRVFEIENVNEAFELVASNQTLGKVVLTMPT